MLPFFRITLHYVLSAYCLFLQESLLCVSLSVLSKQYSILGVEYLEFWRPRFATVTVHFSFSRLISLCRMDLETYVAVQAQLYGVHRKVKRPSRDARHFLASKRTGASRAHNLFFRLAAGNCSTKTQT
jgi:hypothetical protein